MGETDEPLGDVIGYVVDDDPVDVDEFIVACATCIDPDDPAGVIRDDEMFGDATPYPECNYCGEVLNPARHEHEDEPDEFEEIEPLPLDRQMRVGRLIDSVKGDLFPEHAENLTHVELSLSFYNQTSGMLHEWTVTSPDFDGEDVCVERHDE